MEGIQDSRRQRFAMLFGAAATVGAALAFLGTFGFAGAAFNMALGMALALAARVVAGLLRGSAFPYGVLARLLSPLASVALVYFAVGFTVFLRGWQAPDLGRIDEQELDFLALAQIEPGAKQYEARYKVQPPGAYDAARVAFGSLDSERSKERVTKLDFQPVGPAERSIERVDPGPDHRAALRFERVPGEIEVTVKVQATLESESPPEVIHVAVARLYGKRDLAWHVIRHYRLRY